LDWFASLNASRQMPIPFDALPIPLLPRLLGAAVVLTWGALTSRAWTVPVAVVIAMPVIWVISLTPLIALWPMDRLAKSEASNVVAPAVLESAGQGTAEVRAQ
jgi:hypothetical protein